MLATMLDHVPGKQLVDDLDRLEEHRAADVGFWPLTAHDVLVERFAGPQAEPEAPGKHGAERRCRMGDDGRVIAEAGAGHGGPEGQRGPRPERPHERPRERALSLPRGPRMKVLADHEPGVEPGLFGRGAIVQQVSWMELLEHRGVADPGHGWDLRLGNESDRKSTR